MRIFEAPHGAVVVGIDGSDHGSRAADWAAAAADREGLALTLVHSADPFAFEKGGVWSGWGDWHELQRRARADHGLAITIELERLHSRFPSLDVHVVEEYVDPRLALVRLGEHARMLVLGSHGRGPVTSALLGSVSTAVARTARCPVVVVRPDTSGAPRDGITVVVDRAHPSTVTIELAFRHASVNDRPLRVVLCHDDNAADEDAPSATQLRLELSELCAGLGEKFPDVTVRVEPERGALEDVAVGATVSADLTILGRRPHRGATRLARRALTTTVLEHARGPVAIVPEGEH